MRNTELCVRRRNFFRGCCRFFGGDFNHQTATPGVAVF
jgi:hypothetical protein